MAGLRGDTELELILLAPACGGVASSSVSREATRHGGRRWGCGGEMATIYRRGGGAAELRWQGVSWGASYSPLVHRGARCRHRLWTDGLTTTSGRQLFLAWPGCCDVRGRTRCGLVCSVRAAVTGRAGGLQKGRHGKELTS
ncbi:hypothetical protein E2562_029353 [Oryza meyeriana var. granulata]|uniref:Uncharacterized protein n=1 Tax=Oryza meyeriana var. granulata TaxID=110450 RepID=A0A6G1C9Z7_9ORYZ|nr:hypothetical protein E2562_029353 [Oryza meyeriana var. granulata]